MRAWQKRSGMFGLMHSFCDSSKHIYSAVVCLRIKTSVTVSVRFKGEKTKVAPLKSLSILRLELLTCVLLTKLVSEICPPISSRLLIDNRFCCADSEVTLCWVIGKEKSWTPWVGNRVAEV